MGEVKKKRIFYLDELRAIAIFAVILCHVANIYPYATDSLNTLIPYFLSDIGRNGVPIFFMLSGALLLNRKYELVSFFKRRYSRVLIPFVFWIIVISLLMFFVFGNSENRVLHWIAGDPGIPWYIWELLGLYLCIPIINAFINQYKMDGVKYFLIIWSLVIILKFFKLDFINHLYLDYFMGYMGYMILGYYVVNTDLNIDNRVMVLLGFVLFLVFSIINFSISASIGETADYISIPTILQSLGLVIMVKRCAKCGENNSRSIFGKVHNFIENGKIGKILVSISICSYGMYFTHFIICLFWRSLHIHSLKLAPILYIITIFVSWMIILILSKIPILDNISGVK